MRKNLIILLMLAVIFCSCQSEKAGNETPGEDKTTDTAPVTEDISPEATESETAIDSTETSIVPETETDHLETERETTPPIEIITPLELFVTINEVCTSNSESFKDDKGESPDWIELYNSSDSAVNLAGYGISDDPEKPFRYTFTNYLIEARSYVILLATGDVGYNKGVISLPFKLSSAGETLVLTSPDGLEDVISIPKLLEDESYGRTADGGDVVAHLTPTPLATNNTAISVIKAPVPTFSHESGFYLDGFELSMSVPEGCLVFYTTDGSTPTKDSNLYIEPIKLEDASYNPNVYSAIGGTTVNGFVTKNNQDKANVIRAIAIDGEGNVSDIVSATYFVMGYGRFEPYENMPILSLYTDGSNLFDYETGIYVLGKTYDDYMNGEDFDPDKPTWSRPANYFISGMEGERPATIEYFDAEHNFCFVQDVGIRIGGNTSQSSTQKTFKFYARSEYGKSSFDYPMFEGVEFYDTFLMRTGANDFAKTKIRDVLAQTLTAHRDFSTALWQPCVMFLNGEYWGLYMMMERYDSDYFAQHYEINKDELVVIKTGDVDIGLEEDKELYRTLRRFCRNNDLTLPENYEKLCSMIDMQSYIDYVCMNVIISNNDWPGNNTSLWRTRTVDPSNPYADGRWRWASYDTERSMLLYGSGSGEDYTNNSYPKLIKNGLIFGHVYKNEEFKKQFLATLADMLMYDFESERIEPYLVDFELNLNEQMKLNRKRYNTTSDYSREINVIRTFWQHRAEYVLKYTAEAFGLDGTSLSELVVKINISDAGDMLLGDYILPCTDGRYICYAFDAPILLCAVEKEGYRFSHWEGVNGDVLGTDAKIEINALDISTVTAVFEIPQ